MSKDKNKDQEQEFFQSEARHVRLRTRVGGDDSKYKRKSKHKESWKSK